VRVNICVWGITGRARAHCFARVRSQLSSTDPACGDARGSNPEGDGGWFGKVGVNP